MFTYKNHKFYIPLFFLTVVIFLSSTNSFGLEKREEILKVNTSNMLPSDRAGKHRNIPTYFIANKGQIKKDVYFYITNQSSSVYFTKTAIIFDILKTKKNNKGVDGNERLIFSLNFENTGNNVSILGHKKLKGVINYLKGSDPKDWISGVPTYNAILYQNIYKNIDLKIYINGEDIEYDFIVKPNGDPEKILLSYSGIEALTVNRKGELIANTAFGEFKEKKPYIYQEINGIRKEVNGKFNIKKPANKNKNINRYAYNFELSSYDKSYPLIIDPIIVRSTYLGGTQYDFGTKIAIDSKGNVVVAGSTRSENFPTTVGAYRSKSKVWTAGSFQRDTFISKFDPTLKTLIFSTFIGIDRQYELVQFMSLAIDNKDNIIVVGSTNKADFPEVNALPGQPCSPTVNPAWIAPTRGYIFRLDSSGKNINFATCFDALLYDVAVDNDGDIFVTGYSRNVNFPVVNSLPGTTFNSGSPVDTHFTTPGYILPASDGTITMINAPTNGPGASSIVFSTFLGGDSRERLLDIEVTDNISNNSNNIYVISETFSKDFPIKNPLSGQGIFKGYKDATVSIINVPKAGASSVIFSTYLAGENIGASTTLYDLTVDTKGNIYVVGYTSATDYPVVNAFQNSKNGINTSNGVITKISPMGSSILFSTYFGGTSARSTCDSVKVDSEGFIYVLCSTMNSSLSYPLISSMYSPNMQGTEMTLVKLTSTGVPVISTLIGAIKGSVASIVYENFPGSSIPSTAAGELVLDSKGLVYIVGYAYEIPKVDPLSFQKDPAHGYPDPLYISFPNTDTFIMAVNPNYFFLDVF